MKSGTEQSERSKLEKEKSKWQIKMEAVWPEKNRQMSIKVAQNDFNRKIIDFDSFTKIA